MCNTEIMENRFLEIDKSIASLEKAIEEQKEKMASLQQSMLMKICTNSVMKEQYNFELLKYLYKKLEIEKPKLEYDFLRGEPSANDNR